jgi:hypothetical protein
MNEKANKKGIDYKLRAGQLLIVFGCIVIAGLISVGGWQQYKVQNAYVCYTDTTAFKASTYMLYGKVYTDTSYDYEKKCVVNK